MPGATIDHLVSLTIFLVAILMFTTLFSQNMQTAILYQRNREVAMKATDLLNIISLNSGYPENWGKSDNQPTSFGLQDPNIRGYTLSPFSLMRLASYSGNIVTLKSTGQSFSNVSMGYGGYLLVPFSTCVNYTTASRLLGVDGSYGFQLAVTPILTVSVNELRPANPLRIQVTVAGPGLPLAFATIKYSLIVATTPGGAYPGFQIIQGVKTAAANGSAVLDFSSITSPWGAYAIIVNTYLGGLFGIGFKARSSPEMADIGDVIPFVESFETGTIRLTHSYDVHEVPNPSALHYNATFLVLSPDFEFQSLQLGTGTTTGIVNYGGGQPGTVQIPTSDPGLLVVTYRKGNDEGISLLPWGIGSLGVSLKYGNDPPETDWVSTDLREVVVATVSYQIKIEVWSLEGQQVWVPRWRF